jgi:predicted alpha/beta superfamily hydrolase
MGNGRPSNGLGALVSAPLSALLLATALSSCGEPQSASSDPTVDSGAANDAAPNPDASVLDADSGLEQCMPRPPGLPADLQVLEDGRFHRILDFPLEGFEPRHLTVYLPEGYDGSVRYPVVYFTDAQIVFSIFQADAVMNDLVGQGLLDPHLIVAVNSVVAERTAELTPDADPNWPEPSGRGDEFAAQIVTRIKPYIDATYTTRCDRTDTTIAGYSLGGLMCLHMLMRNPEVFGRGLCISSSFWWNERSVLDRFSAYQGPLPVRLWMDVGTREGWDAAILDNVPSDSPVFDHPHAIRAGRDLAIAKGMVLGKDLGFYEAIDAKHFEWDVAKRVPTLLAFTLSDATLTDRAPIGHAFHVWNEQIEAPPSSHPQTHRSTVSFETRYDAPFVLTWPNALINLSSQNPDVATIDATGTIDSVAVGTATFDATWMGLEANDTIEVIAPK